MTVSGCEAVLGVVLGLSYSFLASFWAVLGLSWVCLGLSCASLGPSWACLGRVWARQGPSWVCLGAVLSSLDPENRLGTVWGYLGPFWGPFVGLKWSHFGVVCCGCFLDQLFIFGLLLGPFWGPFRDLNQPKNSQEEPPNSIKTFKVPKTCICKYLRDLFFYIF